MIVIDMHAHFAAKDGVHTRRIDDEVVLLELTQGTYYSLDEIGAKVWERLISGATPNEITLELVEIYDTTSVTLRSDIESLTRDLVEHGLLTIRHANAI